MPDVATTAAVLSSLKTATDIAKYLRESDFCLEKAEMKLKVADLVSALAEAKLELTSLQDLLNEKDKIILELKEAFESKGALIRHNDAYYGMNSEGKAFGVPFCLRCWESDHKKRQLVRAANDHRSNVCTSCGQRYGSWETAVLPTE